MGRSQIEPLDDECADERCFFFGMDHFHYPEEHPVGSDTRSHYRTASSIPPWAERPATIHAPKKRTGVA